jgi:hypothetical protein
MSVATNDGTNIGTFKCESGVLRVTDPCYSKGTWCAGTVANCRKGEWIAEIERKNCGAWGNRIRRLTVTHALGGTGAAIPADFEVGVDSGQAGVFDDARYPDDPDESSFYDKCCRTTLNKPGAGVLRFGVVSCSGFGDGGYAATIRRDAAGLCYRISVEFISEDDAD